MFYLTYLWHELTGRLRLAIVVALGLAFGVGLVITVSAASDGVRQAQSDLLRSLYGIGTDITVTKAPAPPAAGPRRGGTTMTAGPDGTKVCNQGSCSTGAQTIDNLTSTGYGPIPASAVGSVAALAEVTGAAGGLSLTDVQVDISADGMPSGGGPTTFTVDGVDLAHPTLGPLSSASLATGRALAAADATANVAVVDSDYASQHNLKAGSTVTVAKTAFTVAGIIIQPQASNPPDVYIPLARAQALGTSAGTALTGQVNTIYVAAASATAIPAVRNRISAALPGTTVTTSASLAGQVSGSLASTAKLADVLGRWLSVLVLIAAFAATSLLTLSTVTRRVREFGTLKALGWRTRRIVAQVMGESLAMGVLGAAAGIGLGYGGSAIIATLAPTLSATVQTSTGLRMMTTTSGQNSGTVSHTVDLPMSTPVSGHVIVLAVTLAVLAGLLAGGLASWRIARLRPAAALARVA
jgi:putative ABC transport system permease protein